MVLQRLVEKLCQRNVRYDGEIWFRNDIDNFYLRTKFEHPRDIGICLEKLQYGITGLMSATGSGMEFF